MARLDFNYDLAIHQANEIDGIAINMQRLSNNNLQPTINSIGACWRGEASQQFTKYCSTMQTDIGTQVKNLQVLAARIRNMARIIKEAEEQAKEIQRQQTAGSSGGGGGGGGGAF